MDHSNSSEECIVNAGQQAMAPREGNPDAQTAPTSSATVQVMSKYMLFVIRLFARLVTPCSLTGDLIIVGCSDGEKNKQTKKLNYN